MIPKISKMIPQEPKGTQKGANWKKKGADWSQKGANWSQKATPGFQKTILGLQKPTWGVQKATPRIQIGKWSRYPSRFAFYTRIIIKRRMGTARYPPKVVSGTHLHVPVECNDLYINSKRKQQKRTDPRWVPQVIVVPISLCILYGDYYKKADGYWGYPV